MTGWAGIPPELLRKIAASGDALNLRLVCKRWALSLAGSVKSVALAKAAPSIDLLNLAPVETDLQGLAVFSGVQSLDITAFSGVAGVLRNLQALARLQGLRLGEIRSEKLECQLLTGLTALSKLDLTFVDFSLFATTLVEVLASLPKIKYLSLTCEGDLPNAEEGLHLPESLLGGIEQSLVISGKIGLSESDIRALGSLNLESLHVQLCSPAAYTALTALTSLKSLTIRDWIPGPVSGPPQQLDLHHLSQLRGLTRLEVEHTFGNFKVIELNGLTELTAVKQLAHQIPSSLDFDQLYDLEELDADVALTLPYSQDFEYEQLSNVTSLHFQELTPAIVNGEVDTNARTDICVDQLLTMSGLRELSFAKGASDVFGRALGYLSSLKQLSALRIGEARSTGQGWEADEATQWSEALSKLTSLQELEIDGCNNLSYLQLSRLSNLSSLELPGCPNLVTDGLSTIRGLRRLNAFGSRHVAQQCIAESSCYCDLRSLNLRGVALTEADTSQLLDLRSLKRLNLRDTQILPPWLQLLRSLPYLVYLEHDLTSG